MDKAMARLGVTLPRPEVVMACSEVVMAGPEVARALNKCNSNHCLSMAN